MNRKTLVKKSIKLIIPLLAEELRELLDEELKKSRIWTRPWMLKRPELGATNTIFSELQLEDPDEFRALMRMPVEHFNTLLENITPMIQRQDTVLREAIPAKTKLQAALCFIVTGVSYRYLQALYRVSRAAISLFVPEVMDAIYTYLESYIQVPKNNEEWNEVELGFKTRWNFPGCLGAIDGKHVAIEAPPNSGSEFFSYKGAHTIVLMTVADHNYCFRYVNIGANGRNSDAGIFKNSRLRNDLENGLLPKGGFLVGDDAFPLKTYLLKPYGGTNLTEKQRIFNYRLSRARRIVENAFGILASRFRIFHRPIPTEVSTTEKIIRASCALHNWLRLTSPGDYTPRGSFDEEDTSSGTITEGTWRRELIAGLPSITDHNSNFASRAARQLRDNYADYFSDAGAVSWQNRMIY